MDLTKYKLKDNLDKYKLSTEKEYTPNQPLGESTAGQIVSGIATGGFKTLKGIASVAEKIKRAPYDVLKGTSLKESWQAPTGAEKLQSWIEEKKNIEPGTLLESQSTAAKYAQGVEQTVELFIPVLPGKKAVVAEKIASKAGKIYKGAKGVASTLLKGAAESGGKTALQTGGDVEKTKESAIWGAGGELFGKAARTFSPAIARGIERSTLRLTNSMQNKMAKSIDEASEYLNKNKVIGTPNQRYEKIKNIYDKTEDTLQNWLKEGDGANVMINKTLLKNNLMKIISKYENEADVNINHIEKQVLDAAKTLDRISKGSDVLPAWQVNKWKRSVFGRAYRDLVDKPIDYVDHDMGDVAKVAIENATVGKKINGMNIEDFNKEYGQIINSKKLLQLARKKSQIGILERIIAFGIGAEISKLAGLGGVGTIASAGIAVPLAEQLLGTLPRTILAAGIDKLPPDKAEEAIRKILMPYITGNLKEE